MDGKSTSRYFLPLSIVVVNLVAVAGIFLPKGYAVPWGAMVVRTLVVAICAFLIHEMTQKLGGAKWLLLGLWVPVIGASITGIQLVTKYGAENVKSSDFFNVFGAQFLYWLTIFVLAAITASLLQKYLEKHKTPPSEVT